MVTEMIERAARVSEELPRPVPPTNLGPATPLPVGSLPRVLVIGDHLPSEAPGLSNLLGRAEWRFVFSPMGQAAEKIAGNELAAAVVVASPAHLNGHQKELIHVLDELVSRHIGAVVVTYTEEDRALAARMCSHDGLMAVTLDCPPDEFAGRLAGLAATRKIIDGLQRENALLRKFDNGLNSQITQMDEEMRLAARLQVDFLPRKLPEVGNVKFNVFFRPASYVSGDIYDVARLDEGHVAFFVADVVGHGMPAALLTIFLKRTLQTKEILNGGAYRIIPPDEALAHLNNELLGQQLSHCQFVTMAYAILNTRTLELKWARAGHPLPMRLSTEGGAEELDLDGALLGVFADEKFPLQTLQLKAGDSILFYSDGFESAFADPGDPNGGMINERYRAEFAKLAGAGPEEKFAAMVRELDHQAGSLHQRDDLTALMLTIGE
jgi:serine phosphatase RsbU (regulator of sigma subunit)